MHAPTSHPNLLHGFSHPQLPSSQNQAFKIDQRSPRPTTGLRCVLFTPFFHPSPFNKNNWVCPPFSKRGSLLRGRVLNTAGSHPAGWREQAGAGRRGPGESRANAAARPAQTRAATSSQAAPHLLRHQRRPANERAGKAGPAG